MKTFGRQIADVAPALPSAPRFAAPAWMPWQRGRLPGPLVLGVMLMVAALLLDRAWVGPWQDRVKLAEAQALARPAALRSAPRWPPAEQAEERISHLLLRAQREGLRVQRSQERADPQNASHMFEMQAHGGYGDLRRFLEQALESDPALVLESLQVRRAQAFDARSVATGVADGEPALGRGHTLRIDLRWRLLHQPAGARS